jgi:hypothetical protein
MTHFTEPHPLRIKFHWVTVRAEIAPSAHHAISCCYCRKHCVALMVRWSAPFSGQSMWWF